MYDIQVIKSHKRRQFGRSRTRWEDNIKVVCESVDEIQCVWDSVHWMTRVNTGGDDLGSLEAAE